MTPAAKRELLKALRPRYLKASKAGKSRILDEFVAATGYHRKYAIQLLKNGPPARRVRQGGTPSPYTGDVVAALVQVWEASGYLCSKRLHPFMDEWLDILERHNELVFAPRIKALLCQMSPATIDRKLQRARAQRGRQRGLSGGGGRDRAWGGHLAGQERGPQQQAEQQSFRFHLSPLGAAAPVAILPHPWALGKRPRSLRSRPGGMGGVPPISLSLCCPPCGALAHRPRSQRETPRTTASPADRAVGRYSVWGRAAMSVRFQFVGEGLGPTGPSAATVGGVIIVRAKRRFALTFQPIEWSA